MPQITLQDLVVRYGRVTALAGVTCAIEGGAVGLLGPNGAGKSTLIRTLLGFIRPIGGRLSVLGMEMPRRFLEVRQRVGYMPEREVVSPKVSAVSFVSYCGRLCGMGRVDAMERAHEVLNFVGMGENRYRPTETYSTGMLQRVKFAAALIHDPRLLLLDEPTNGLDPDGRAEMLELIRDLPRKRNMTVLLSSHLLPDVQQVCDSVIMISKGEVVYEGSLEEVTRPRENLFEVRVRENKERFQEVLAQHGYMSEDDRDGTLVVSKPGDRDVRELFALAAAQGTQVRRLAPVRHSLEEAFMKALGKG